MKIGGAVDYIVSKIAGIERVKTIPRPPRFDHVFRHRVSNSAREYTA